MTDRRLLSPASAADYLDVDALPLMLQGRNPAPDYAVGPRSPRYDREALDEAMGGAASKDPDRMVEVWLEEREKKEQSTG